MLLRVCLASLVIAPFATWAVIIYLDRALPQQAAREAVTRIAHAMSRGDRSGLANEFPDHPEMVDWLLDLRPKLIGGTRIGALNNGDRNRYVQTRETVSHVGIYQTDGGDVLFGFLLDRQTEQLTFVAARFVPR